MLLDLEVMTEVPRDPECNPNGSAQWMLYVDWLHGLFNTSDRWLRDPLGV